ncbi:hypothetical protein LIER_08273 [Lithospermum erythrorhizon]|uniref:non-specific serine/threonine protein kinase n=1 Tax=Lithospermum erythrorhizon TaxID=34254 RepID=A0AAV3PCG8_LITER
MPRGSADRVIVAVKAEKSISKNALAWALTHVARQGDSLMLLAVLSHTKERSWFWRSKKQGRRGQSSDYLKFPDRINQISDSCSEMVLQFHQQFRVSVRIKVVSPLSFGVVASEARNTGADWVVLDKKLKHEQKLCMEELHCNIVLMKGSQAKVLKLNLASTEDVHTPFISAPSSPVTDSVKFQEKRVRHSTPVSSPENPAISYRKSSVEKSFAIPEIGSLPFLVYEKNPLYEGHYKEKYGYIHCQDRLSQSFNAMDSIGQKIITLSKNQSYLSDGDRRLLWLAQNQLVDKNVKKAVSCRDFVEFRQSPTFTNYERSSKHTGNFEGESSIRKAVSLDQTSSISPPLCSICQHKAPSFGKPPRQFSFDELEEATSGFADANFLAEGGFGVVHRGVLENGQVVAVKQLKFGGLHGDADFCREVRVLSCAQHKNVVLLIGFCVEGNKRLLVYEYICNGSLEFHLHGNLRKSLDWSSRLKIAIGTARGLRYLHEDCRVGCIVHRDLRPNNILLTHDFEPQVADFGIARLHCEWETFDEERVVGTAGYLAPEYFCGGKLTEKVDAYAFGLILLELITGRKNYRLPHNEDSVYSFSLLEQLRLLEHSNQVLDPCLEDQPVNLPHELQAMYRAAVLCLQQDPDLRPSMSKVLGTLEGCSSVPRVFDVESIGSRSGYMQGLNPKEDPHTRRHYRTFSD